MHFFKKDKNQPTKNPYKILLDGVYRRAVEYYRDRIYPINHEQTAKEVFYGVCLGLIYTPLSIGKIYYLNKKYSIETWTTLNGYEPKELYRFSTVRQACVYSPIIEEIIFRSVLMPAIYMCTYGITENKNAARVSTALGSGLVFATLHPSGVRFPSFIAGTTYAGITMLFDGSLWASTTAHVTNNALALASYRRGFIK